MSAVASTTPPWKPPDGLACACVASHQPMTTTGPTSTRAAARTALVVAGRSRPRAASTGGCTGSCSLSPRSLRSTTLIPAAAVNRMNSSPTVSKPR